MTELEPLLPLLYACVAAGGAYMGTRVEIRHLWRKIGELEKSVERAHERLDKLSRART